MKGKNYSSDWPDRFREWEAEPQPTGDWDSPSFGLWDRIAEDLPPTPPARSRWLAWLLSIASVLMLSLVLWGGGHPQVLLGAFPVPQTEQLSVANNKDQIVISTSESPAIVATTPIAKHGNVLHSIDEQQEALAEVPNEPQPANQQQKADERHLIEEVVTNQLRQENRRVVQLEFTQDEADEQAANQPGAEIRAAEQYIAVPLNLESARMDAEKGVAQLVVEEDSKQVAIPPTKSWASLVYLPPIGLHGLETAFPVIELPEPQLVDLPRTSKNQSGYWLLSSYTSVPLGAGIQYARRNWRINETAQLGLGLSLRRTHAKAWFAQLGLQYDQSDFIATTRYLRVLNPTEEQEVGGQLISSYDIDDSVLKSAGAPTTVTVERNRNEVLPANQRIILEVETSITEQRLRIPLYLGRQFKVSPKLGLQLQAGAVLNRSTWERRTNSVTLLTPLLRVREVRFPDRIQQIADWSAQLALGAGLSWQVHPNWQLGLQWQLLGENKAAPVILQQQSQQLLLGVGYRW